MKMDNFDANTTNETDSYEDQNVIDFHKEVLLNINEVSFADIEKSAEKAKETDANNFKEKLFVTF